jgi:hypothetical protein
VECVQLIEDVSLNGTDKCYFREEKGLNLLEIPSRKMAWTMPLGTVFGTQYIYVYGIE